MSDLKNIAKIFGILFIIFGWFFYEFRLYETDDDVKSRFLTRKYPRLMYFVLFRARNIEVSLLLV